MNWASLWSNFGSPRVDVVTFAGLSDIGRRRRNNEDAFGAFMLHPSPLAVSSSRWSGREDPGGGLLLAVSDGMGGARAGEVASRLALAEVAGSLARVGPAAGADPRGAARAAAVAAHREIFAQGSKDAVCGGMGATFCGIWFRAGDRTATLLNVGDSRAYRWRGRRLERLSRDQTLAQGMIDRGELTPAQAAAGRLGGILEHALGADGRPIEPETKPVDLRAGDLLLLCSDGLHGAIDDVALAGLLPAGPAAPDLPGLASRLVAAARDASGSDNITVLLASLGSGR